MMEFVFISGFIFLPLSLYWLIFDGSWKGLLFVVLVLSALFLIADIFNGLKFGINSINVISGICYVVTIIVLSFVLKKIKRRM